MATEAVDILKDFYVQTNPNAPVPKPKVGRERKPDVIAAAAQ
jgi:hypothetical protein